MGTPPPAVRTRRFVPRLPRSVGFLPTFSPPKGGVGHRAIQRQPLPGNPLQGVRVSQALFPQGDDDVRLHPLLETAMGRAPGAPTRLVQGMPLAPCAQHEKDGIHRFAVINAGPMAPQGMWRARWEQGRHALPACVWDAPGTASLFVDGRHPCNSVRLLEEDMFAESRP